MKILPNTMALCRVPFLETGYYIISVAYLYAIFAGIIGSSAGPCAYSLPFDRLSSLQSLDWT